MSPGGTPAISRWREPPVQRRGPPSPGGTARSSPEEAFVKLHPGLLEKPEILLLKPAGTMMLLLTINVIRHRLAVSCHANFSMPTSSWTHFEEFALSVRIKSDWAIVAEIPQEEMNVIRHASDRLGDHTHVFRAATDL